MEQGGYLNSQAQEPSQGASVLRSSPSSSTSPNISQSQPVTRPRSLSGGHGAPPKIRRRNRLITSCLECRRRKLKCDKAHPCGNCTKFVRDCVYLAPALDPVAQLKLAEIKEKMGSLERTLEEDVARRSLGERGDHHSGMNLSSGSSDEDEPPGPEDEKNLEPTPLAFIDAAYYEDADDDLMDLGVTIGKMRITERLGGFVRPKIAFEMAHVLNSRHTAAFKNDRKNSNGACVFPRTPVGPQCVAPSDDFTAPSSGFFFSEEPKKSAIMQFLPSRSVADRLLEQYWEAVHYMARVVHRPTFERQWQQFWECISVGMEPPPTFQALVMGTLLSAAISMSEDRVAYEFGAVKSQLVDSFRQGTEMALFKANFLRTTKLHTLQALVMYLVALTRREVSRSHSALTGAAIRLAECMGLHRDGSHYGLSPVEIHVRRIIWYQLCFLDIRTCEATGPRPQIHKEDYDTRLPLNVNDIDLERPNPPTEDSDKWTDMTFTLIRFECNEMHRFIWRERPRLEEKKITLTHVLGKVQSFIHGSEKKYLPMLNKDVPLQYMALLVYRLITYRMHVMVLHRYATLPLRPMPERLRKILLSSGVQQVECAVLIETAPPLKKWAWYLGTFHQYHTALLLLSELYATPERYYEDRIWDCLDYVFETPASMERGDKARMIFEEVVEKTQYYHSLRKVRAPKALEDGLAAAAAWHEKMSRNASNASATAQHFRSPDPRAQRDPRDRHSGSDQVLSSEFRNYTFLPETQFYAHHGRMSHSPRSAEGQVPEISSNVPDPGTSALYCHTPSSRVDIDWNEWDKLFPPDVSIPDLSPQEYDSNVPRGYGHTFQQHQQHQQQRQQQQQQQQQQLPQPPM